MTDPWSDDELPPRRRRSPLIAVVAVLVVFALVGGAIEVALDRGSDDDARTSSSATTTVPSPSTTSKPPTEAQLDATVATISDFVAHARDLPFDHPVKVTLLADAPFAKRVADDALDDEKQLTETEDVLRAVGLIKPGVSLSETLTSFLSQGVVGFYDPKTDELVVRGAALTPYVRITLAHELTHALDDQHFQLDRPDLDAADDERGIAFSSLVEGNAVRIEEKYRQSLSKAERAQATAEESRLGQGLDLTKVPRVIPELVGFPYIFGPALAGALADAGGERRVDAAFSAPPVTSEQVVNPKAWLAGSAAPVTVPPPAADGAVFDQGELGFWGIYILLEEELGQKVAADAATGWGGDWYVAWRQGSSACVRASFAMDGADDLRQLGSALDDWAAAQAHADVTRANGRVGFTSCG